jgi:hypothetical protein
VQIIVSIIVAAYEGSTDRGKRGYKSLGFAAIWSMFLVIAFTYLGYQIAFTSKSTELLVGFMIGVAAMLTELFFVLMCIFFIIGSEGSSSNQSNTLLFYFNYFRTFDYKLFIIYIYLIIIFFCFFT